MITPILTTDSFMNMMASLSNGEPAAQVPSSESPPEHNFLEFCEGSFQSYPQFLSTFDPDNLCTKPGCTNNTVMDKEGELASPHQDSTTSEPESCDHSISRPNPFSYSPGQLNKLLNPKSLAAFYALGGLEGLRNGLSTNRLSGLPSLYVLLMTGIAVISLAFGVCLSVYAKRGKVSIDWADDGAIVAEGLMIGLIAFILSCRSVRWQEEWLIPKLKECSVMRFQSKSSGNCKGIVKLLALSQMIAPAFASDGAVDLMINSGTTWPSSEKPSTLVACSVLILINICTRIWPNQFRNSVMAWFLLSFSTLAMWCVVPDIIASKTLLLCFLVQQLNLCHLLAQGSHTMVPGRPYTMSIHLWPVIGILTLSEAYFASSSWVWTNQSHWLVSTIPWLGVNVLLCIYLGCLWASYIKPWLFYHRAQMPIDEGA